MLKKTFIGNAFLLGDHVNTDILHPPDYFSLKKDRIASGLSKGAEDFFSRMAKDDIIVAGRNFGCGSSRESSARSFAYNGIAVIVAESFARIFFRNLTNQGIYLITCPGIAKKAVQGEPIVIDLEKLEVRSERQDWALPCSPLPEYTKSVLEKGGLLKFLEEELKTKQVLECSAPEPCNSRGELYVEQIDFLFVHVPKKSSFYKPLGEFMNITFMPMGLFAMSDFLNRSGFSSQIVHLGVEWIEDTSFSLVEWLKDKKVKVIGMPIHWHYQAYDTIDVAKKIKAQYPGIRIVLGGFTASFFAKEILENFSCIDAVVRGDGERPVVEFMKALSANAGDFSAVPNLTWRRGAEIVENPLSYVAEKKDLDDLNFTNLKLLKNYPTYVRSFSFPLAWMKNFTPERNIKHHSIGTSLFPLAIGRGCPVNCSFCGGSYEGQLIISGRKKVIFRDPEKVVESMEQAKSYGYQTMSICYDPTPRDDRYFQELFKLIRKKNLGLDWYFECWALPTKRFIEAFKETFPGKYSILAISAESSSERVRKMNKGFFYSNKELYEALDFMKEKNVFLDMFFTVGIPHETIAEAMQTKEMMATISRRYKKILKRMMVWTIQIEPGAPQFLHPEKYGIVSDRSTFMDFYRSHGGQDSDTYSALGYYNNTFFTGAEKQYNAHEFSEEMQKLKCDHFCFLHPDASKYNTPFKGRVYCTYRSLYWKLKGLDKKPAKRDVFS